MARITKALSFLLPAIVAAVCVIWAAIVDQTLQSILITIFYVFTGILASGIGLLILFVLWQLTKTGLYILLGTKTQATTKDTE
jgi:hypothetical protein